MAFFYCLAYRRWIICTEKEFAFLFFGFWLEFVFCVFFNNLILIYVMGLFTGECDRIEQSEFLLELKQYKCCFLGFPAKSKGTFFYV